MGASRPAPVIAQPGPRTSGRCGSDLLGRSVRHGLRAAAVSSWVVLAVLSLVPGTDRPHTGLGGNPEHLVAYGLAACVTGLAFAGRPRQLLGFSLASAVFELCQIRIPGRMPGVDNWLASSAGACLGLLLAGVLHRLSRFGR